MGILLQFLLGFCCYELFVGSVDVMGAPAAPSPIRIVMQVHDYRGVICASVLLYNISMHWQQHCAYSITRLQVNINRNNYYFKIKY